MWRGSVCHGADRLCAGGRRACAASYTAGVLDELMDWGLAPDGILGVSAGAIHGASFVSGQQGAKHSLTPRKYCRNWRFMSLRSMLLTGDLVGARLQLRGIALPVGPFLISTRFSGALCASTPWLPMWKRARRCAWRESRMRTPCWKPLGPARPCRWCPPSLSWEGRRYLDGGTADSIPLKRFEDMGYTRVPRGAHAAGGLRQAAGPVARPSCACVTATTPPVVRACERRHEVYNASLAYAGQAQAEGRALVLCPSRRIPIGRVETNPEVLEAQYQLGRADARAARERIEAFLGTK